MLNDYPELYNNSWFLVFFHDISYGHFLNKKEASFSLKKHKYSVLKKIDDSFKINGVFEFLLKYPNATGQNHWTQTVSPAYANPNTENGYAPINVSWTDYFFHGLAISNQTYSYIDGSPFHDSWFYSIGKFSCEEYLAGPTWGTEQKRYYQVFLWMRVNDPHLLKKLFSICTIPHKRHAFNSFTISLLFLIC